MDWCSLKRGPLDWGVYQRMELRTVRCSCDKIKHCQCWRLVLCVHKRTHASPVATPTTVLSVLTNDCLERLLSKISDFTFATFLVLF